MTYTLQNLEAQLRILKAQIAGEHALLARLPTIQEDVRRNHERTIKMRLDHYEKRAAAISARIAACAQGEQP